MLKAVREIGSVLCRIALWDCFGDAGVWLLLLAVIRVHRELSRTYPQHNPMVQLKPTPAQLKPE